MSNISDIVAVRDSIRSCTACQLRRTATRPVPWSGPTPSSYLFVGMAPGRYEDQEGQPFIGKSGIYLRMQIKQAGFPKDVAFANAVSCYPGPNGKGGDRKPVRSELEACRTNLLAQITLIKPRFIFLVGTTALEAFRPDLEIGHVHGKPLYYDGVDHGLDITWAQAIHLWTIYHPAAALRQIKYAAAIKQDLESFWGWRRANMPWVADCYVCGREPHYCDAWGYMTCELHSMRQAQLFP